MAVPPSSTCSLWATSEDLCAPCLDYDAIDPDLIDKMLQIASDTLFIKSGQRFPGECSSTVRPCGLRVYYDSGYRYPYPATNTFRPSPGCSCASPRACGCPRPSEILLGAEPLVSIEEVKIDGVVVDPSLYRIDDYRWLVRLRDPDGSYASWPCCQDVLLPDTDPDTFSVSFTYGRTPPLAGTHAAAILACELIQSCNPIEGSECRLPRRVVSLNRQGVSILLQDPTQLLTVGRYGITEIDDFIATYNPHNLRRPMTTISPDLRERVRRAGT